MAYRNDWARYIRSRAARYNLDPRALLAVAAQEGLSGGVGDGGHAFGAFQLNDAGGVLTGRPGNHRAFAESPQGIDWALAQIGQVAGGLRGPDAVRAIVSKFERPRDPGGEIARALSGYGKFGGAQAGPSSLPVAAPDSAPQPDIRRLLATQLASGKGVDWLALARQRTMAQQAPQAPRRMPLAADAPASGGFPQMAQHGGRIPGEPDLSSAPQADTSHVDTRILTVLEQFARSIGKPIQIISGYRSPGYSAKVGGYASDPHTRGVAVDAYIGGVPIGSYPGAYKWLTAHGLESGAQPGFYRGKSDPEHVQIPGSGVNKKIRARSTR